MTTSLKLRRGTTAQHVTFTGAEGEITVDTTKDTVVVHDGATAGGFPLAKRSDLTAPNTSFTQGGTGAVARTVEDKLKESVSVKDFGAVGDGVTNDTAAFQNAVTYLAGGGRLRVPRGNYKLTDEIVLPAGIRIEGENAADNVYGAPPAYAAQQSYIWQATANKAIFFIGGGLTDIHISGIAFAASQTVSAYPLTTPVTDERYGIKCYGSYPQHSWFITIEDCLFYNLKRGISVVDPYAGTNPPPHTYDWNSCPMTINRCRFLYPKTGIYFDTNNADCITVSQAFFGIPYQGYGVYIRRAGYQYYVNCIGGGASVESNIMFWIEGNGTDSIDNITLDNCQAESLTQFINFTPAATSNLYRINLNCRNCIAEMGSDIYLAGNCHFSSYNNRWTVGIYINSTAVRITSIGDYFGSGNQFWFLSSNPSTAFVNLLAGPDTASIYQDEVYQNGRLTRYGTAAPTSGTFKVGDRVINKSGTLGAPAEWRCVVAGTPGTWASIGQIGFRSQAGTPVNTVTPLYVGEEFFNFSTYTWYKAYGLESPYWRQFA